MSLALCIFLTLCIVAWAAWQVHRYRELDAKHREYERAIFEIYKGRIQALKRSNATTGQAARRMET